MILKLRSVMYYGTKHEFGWEMISDITSFRFSKINKEQREEKERLGINMLIQSLNDKGKVEEKNQEYVYIQAWYKRGSQSLPEPINIITNLMAYMLNDEGKTIERIN